MTIPVSVAFKAALAANEQTFCTLLRVEWTVGPTAGTVLGFTDHNKNIVYDDGDGSVTYLAAVGYRRRDVSGSSDLSVDNSEYEGILDSPSITEADLAAGLWDYAALRYYVVNYSDLTMGHLRVPSWKIGQVVLRRNEFTAEVRGIMQAYTRNIGELLGPGCRANLGDARCKVNLAPFTVTGTLDSVSADQMTLFDSARVEAGASGAIVITNVSNANPGQVTLTAGGGASFTTNQPVTISGVLGPTLVNQNTLIRNLSGDTFDLGIDTSDVLIYPAYAGGGFVTPLGGSSGYFAYGIITITSGANAGFSQDILSYEVGQWTLQLPFPYPLAGTETYTMVAGCDKSLSTCKNRFANVINMRAEPYLPGIDKIVQVGKQ